MSQEWGKVCCVTHTSMGTQEEAVAIVAGGEAYFARPDAVRNRLRIGNLMSIPGASRDASILAEPRPAKVDCVLNFGVMIDEIGLDGARRYRSILPPKTQKEFFG